MKAFFKGFIYAAAGIKTAFYERNFRFHLCAAAVVTYFAARFYSLSRAEWAALFITFGLVISLEAVNTSIEKLCDKVCSKNDLFIKQCKDCAAGAVLISAAASVMVGISIFWDLERFALIFKFFSEKPWRIVLLIISFILMACFVFFFPFNNKNDN